MRSQPSANPETIVSSQVPIALAERLRTSARRHDRSVSAEIRRALLMWVSAQDADGK